MSDSQRLGDDALRCIESLDSCRIFPREDVVVEAQLLDARMVWVWRSPSISCFPLAQLLDQMRDITIAVLREPSVGFPGG